MARLGDRYARVRGGHVEQVAFVEGRHELGADPLQGVPRGRKGDDRDRDGQPPHADRCPDHGPVEEDEQPAQGVPALRQQAAPDQVSRHDRYEGNGQQGGRGHRVGLGIGQRLEESAFLGLQGEDRREGERDDQQRVEEGRSHFLGGVEHDPPVVLLPAVPLHVLVGVLDHDDGGVHQRADGDGDPAQGHDVGVDPLPGHDEEGGEHADRQGEDDHQGRTEVDQEDDTDQGDDETFHQQLVAQVVDGPFDQARPIVGRNDLHALRQARLERLQLLLDVPDDLHGVLAVPHDDDAADDLALAVPFRQSPPKFRSRRDPGDLVKEYGRPETVDAQRHVLQVLHGLDVPQPADHVLGLRHFHDPAAHVVVAPLDCRLDPVERYVVDQQLVGVDLHLVLLDEPADAGDLGHPVDRSEFVPEEPVLDAPQFRQVVPVAPEHVLVDPAHARGVGPERGVHARRQAVGHVAQVLQHAAAGPVDVRAVLEDDVYEA